MNRSHTSVKAEVEILCIGVASGVDNAALSIFQCKTSADSRLNKVITVAVFARIHRNGTNVSVLLMSNVMLTCFLRCVLTGDPIM